MDYTIQLTQRLRRMAIADHAEYPQYEGLFDDWVVARAVRRVKYKGGSSLHRGRWVLASPQLDTWYDPDTGHLCHVVAGHLDRVSMFHREVRRV